MPEVWMVTALCLWLLAYMEAHVEIENNNNKKNNRMEQLLV